MTGIIIFSFIIGFAAVFIYSLVVKRRNKGEK